MMRAHQRAGWVGLNQHTNRFRLFGHCRRVLWEAVFVSGTFTVAATGIRQFGTIADRESCTQAR
jgi:hypothetical protein